MERAAASAQTDWSVEGANGAVRRYTVPNVKNRDDPEAVALQHSMDPGLVLAALDEHIVDKP